MVVFVVNELVQRVGCVYLVECFLCLILWEKQNYCLLVHYLHHVIQEAIWSRFIMIFTPAAVKLIMIRLEIAIQHNQTEKLMALTYSAVLQKALELNDL